MRELEKEFGKLGYHENDFTNTGVHHRLFTEGPDKGSVCMDQDSYIKALKPIVHPDLVGAKAETPASPALGALYWSLLGALAYCLITQHWVAVYVVALQRVTQAPKCIHLRRLNALVRILQRKPAQIWFRSMECLSTLECHSDSGFSKEDQSGYGIRGANFMRVGKDRSGSRV